jgi:hypothetical protein
VAGGCWRRGEGWRQAVAEQKWHQRLGGGASGPTDAMGPVRRGWAGQRPAAGRHDGADKPETAGGITEGRSGPGGVMGPVIGMEGGGGT